jgi:hypothetical protein
VSVVILEHGQGAGSRPVRLHIERLVIEGVSSSSDVSESFAAQLARALARGLSAGGLGARSMARTNVQAAPVSSAGAPLGPETAGRVGRAVLARLRFLEGG